MQENLILLVEDCAEDASLVLASFKRWGITNPIQIVPDGEKAVEFLCDPKHPLPRLAILDLNLPTLSGFDVLRWIRADKVHQPGLANLPVVVLSGTTDMTDFDKAHQLGANACVVKSLDLHELYDLIQHLDYFALATDYHGSEVEWSPEP